MSGRDESFSRKLGPWILRWRWAIVLVNLLVFAALFAGMGKRGKAFGEHVAYMQELRNNPLAVDSSHVAPPPIFNADYHVFFEHDNPDLIAFDRLQSTYAKEDMLVVAVRAVDGDIFTNAHLQSLRELTEGLWQAPYVSRVDGLVNFNYTTAEGDDLVVEDFIAELPLDEAAMAEKKAIALADPLIPKFLLSKDAGMTQVMARVIAPPEFSDAHLDTKAAAVELVERLKAENPGLEIRMGGNVMMTAAFTEFGQRDAQTLMPLMFFIIAVLLAVLFRSFWGTALPMVVLFSSVLFPIFLFVGVLNFSLTNVSLNVIQILVAVAVADSVHLMAGFFQALRGGKDKRAAIIETVDKNFVACLLTSVTTAVGFFSLFGQDIPPFKDLGLFAGVGALYAFVASVFTLPALLSFLPLKPGKPKAKPKYFVQATGNTAPAHTLWAEPLAAFVSRRRAGILLASLLLSIGSVAFLFRIQVDSNAVHYFSKDTEFRQASEYIDSAIIGTYPLEFSFDAGEANGVYDPAFLKKIERFHNWMASKPEYELTHVSSVVDVVKRLNQTMHGGDPAYYSIPDRDSVTAEGDTLYARNLIAQYMLLYSLSLPQGMDLTNQLSLDNSHARVTAFQRTMSSWRQLENVEEINTWLDSEMPEIGARALGVPVMFSRMFKQAIPGILRSTAISLALITLLLAIVFRSWKLGLLSMIPNMWPMLVMYGGVGLAGVTVNMSVAFVGMITLGIVVDDCIHFLVKWLRAVRGGMEHKAAIAYTYRETGSALVLTSVILCAGFGSLMLSDFAVNQDLGLYCSIVIALALFADLIILPAVILQLVGKGVERDDKKIAASEGAPKEEAVAQV